MRGRSFHENFPATAFLLLFIMAFFALEVIEHRRLVGAFPALASLGGVSPEVTRILGSLSLSKVCWEHEYWRLLSAAFLHGGYIHILFNGWVLYDVGRFCEPLVSSWKFLVIYVLCALGGSFGSLLWNHVGGTPRQPSVGASGAIFGLIGLMLVYSIRGRHEQLRDHMVSWIIFIVLFSLLGSRILDHGGHIGGFAVGCLLGLTVKDYMPSHAAARWRYPGYLAALVLAASLLSALWHYLVNR